VAAQDLRASGRIVRVDDADLGVFGVGGQLGVSVAGFQGKGEPGQVKLVGGPDLINRGRT
jgi:hypothetical protein